MSKIELKQISKVYGASPKKTEQVLTKMSQGATSQEIKQTMGCNVGLYNINLTINSGELHCIMGLSGSGKSTLVRHINRLIDPSAGEIWIEHDNEMVNVTALDVRSLEKWRQSHMSMVFQHFGLFSHMTVLENVAYGLRIQGITKEKRYDSARYWLNEVGLSGSELNYPHALSGGMQQRVGLARALAVNTPIILMDEAFSALDPLIRNQLQDQLIELQNRLHKTIVFITHDIDEAIKLGNRISILKGGQLIQSGTPKELKQNPNNDYVSQFLHKIEN